MADERLRFTLEGRDNLSRALNQAGTSADRLKKSLKGIGVAASIPAAAAGATAALSLAAGIGAAAGALAAFGLAAGPQVKQISDLSKAHTKYEDAVSESGRASAEAAKAQLAYSKAAAKLPMATREAAAAFLVAKDAYMGWSDALADDTMPVVTKGIQIFTATLPKLTPLVRGTSKELSRMMDVLGGMASSPALAGLIDRFTEFSSGIIYRATTELANLSGTISRLDAGPLNRFLAIGEEHGPLVAETLKNVALALANILTASSGVGVAVLNVANALAKLVNAFPPEALAVIVQAYAAFRILSVSVAATTAVAMVAAARLRVVGRAMAVVAIEATTAGGAIAGLRAGFAALSATAKIGLIAGAVVGVAMAVNYLADESRGAPPDVDRLTTSLKRLAVSGKEAGELKNNLGGLRGLGAQFRTLSVDAKQWESVNNSLGGTVTKSLRRMYDYADAFKRGGESAKAAREDFAGLDKSLAGLVSSGNGDTAALAFDRIAEALRKQGFSADEVKKKLPEYRDALAAAKVAQELAAESMGLFGKQAQATSQKLEEQKASADGLRAAYHELNNAVLMARGGIRGMEAAIDAASAAFKENGSTLDVNTEKGRANQEALDNIAASTMKAAESARANGASWSTVSGIYDRGRGSLVKVAEQMGLTSAQADKLANRILKVPNKTVMFKGEIQDLDAKIKQAQQRVDSLRQKRKTAVGADKRDVDQKIADAQRRIDNLRQKRAAAIRARDATGPGVSSAKSSIDSVKGKTVEIFVNVWRTTRNKTFTAEAPGVRKAQGGPIRGYATGGHVQGFPTGGAVRGPGTATSDSVPAMLSNGEYVIKAAAVSKYGEGMLDAINQMRVSARPTRVSVAAAAPATSSNTTVNVYPQRADFTVADLEALQRRTDARARVGRPR